MARSTRKTSRLRKAAAPVAFLLAAAGLAVQPVEADAAVRNYWTGNHYKSDRSAYVASGHGGAGTRNYIYPGKARGGVHSVKGRYGCETVIQESPLYFAKRYRTTRWIDVDAWQVTIRFNC